MRSAFTAAMWAETAELDYTLLYFFSRSLLLTRLTRVKKWRLEIKDPSVSDQVPKVSTMYVPVPSRKILLI